MPAIVPIFTGIAAALGTSAVTLGLGLAAIGIKIGLTVYQAKKAKKAARRSSGHDIQQNFSQGALPRYAVFGKCRVGGQRIWFEAADKVLVIVTVLSDDIIDRIIGYYVRGIECLVDSNNFVTTPPFRSATVQSIQFEVRYGYMDQPVSSILLATFPSVVTANHRGAGIAYLVTKITQPATEAEFQTMFNGQVPEIAALVAGWPCYDPRSLTHLADKPTTWAHTTNPALILLHYMTADNGAGWSRSLFALNTIIRVADYCDQLVATKSGALLKRYECGGFYTYDEEPADVIDKMLDTFAGRIYITEGGYFGLTCDGLEVPQVTITADKVLEITANRRAGALYECTTIRTRFSSDAHGYVELAEEADPWIDEETADQIGREIPVSFDLPYVSRHDQARRLMKRQFYELNPEWDIEMTLDVEGLELFGEGVCTFVYPLLGIDATFRLLDVSLDQSSGLTRVNVKMQSISPKASEWDPETEEGTAPALAPVASETPVPQTPTGLSVICGTSRTIVYWTSFTSGKTQEARYSPAGAGTWTTVTVSPTDRAAQLTGLTASASYDFQVRVVDAAYGTSDWASITFTNTDIASSTGALGTVNVVGGVERISIGALQSTASAAAEIEFTSVADGAAVSWAGSTKAKASPGQLCQVTITSVVGARDVYCRSVGINNDTGAVTGPLNATVTATPPTTGTGGSISGNTSHSGNEGRPTYGGWGANAGTGTESPYGGGIYDADFGGDGGGGSSGGIY